MTDTTSTIDHANAAVMAAETQALQDFAAKYATFVSDVATIVATLGTGAPSTGARDFFNRAQTTFASTMTMDLANVMRRYGLATPTVTP